MINKRQKMKKVILSLVFCSFAISGMGQVLIGKEPKISQSYESVLMDFYDETDNIRGIILPAVDGLANLSESNNGTFLFDKTDSKIKMYQNNTWVELSDEGSGISIIENTSSEADKGVVIGAETSPATGVLVLEDSTKALVLPKINKPEETVNSPYVGMMCYDTASKSVAIFDGTVWNYLK